MNFRDLNDDALASLVGDYTPSFRNSIGEIVGVPSSPAVSVLATAGSFCNDDGEGSVSGITQREESSSPSKANSKNELRRDVFDAHDEPITVSRIVAFSLKWRNCSVFWRSNESVRFRGRWGLV